MREHKINKKNQTNNSKECLTRFDVYAFLLRTNYHRCLFCIMSKLDRKILIILMIMDMDIVLITDNRWLMGLCDQIKYLLLLYMETCRYYITFIFPPYLLWYHYSQHWTLNIRLNVDYYIAENDCILTGAFLLNADVWKTFTCPIIHDCCSPWTGINAFR